MGGEKINILMLVTGDYTKDPRVKRERDALEEAGHSIYIFDWRDKPLKKTKILFGLPFWWKRMLWEIWLLQKVWKIDVVHCHDFDTLLLGIMIKKRYGCKLVYDSHEMYSYMVNIWTVLPFEKLFLSSTDHVIASGPGVKKYLEKLGARDIEIVRNSKSLLINDYMPVKNNKELTVCYFGTLTSLRMFPELIDIIGNIEGVRFLIGGYGALKDSVEEKIKNYDNVEYLGFVKEKEIYDYTMQSDFTICMLDPSNRNCRYGFPNKLYESLVCGRPLMAPYETSCGDFLASNKAGFPVMYDKEHIEKTIKYLRDHKYLCENYGKNALELARSGINWDVDKRILQGLYEAIA